MGEQAAKWIIAPDILKHYSFASGYSLVEIKPKDHLIGKKVEDLKLRENFNLGIAAIEKRTPDLDDEGHSIFKITVKSPPDPGDTIQRDDILVMFGLDSAIEKFTQGD